MAAKYPSDSNRLADVFQDEVVNEFVKMVDFKTFARSKRGLCLDENDIENIVADNQGSVHEQKIQILIKWQEKSGSTTTAFDIRSLVKKFKDPESGKDYVELSPELAICRNEPLCKESFVYCGEQRSEVTGPRKVCIKLTELKEKNIREAKNLMKLSNHPNVLAYFHSGIYTGNPLSKQMYIVTELCRRENLGMLMEENKKSGIHFSESQKKAIAVQFLGGMKYIHLHRIIHRDIKPSNVLVSIDGTLIKISDYGLSKSLQNGRSNTNLSILRVGTDGFRAPETYSNDVITLKSDVFSSGLILYYDVSNGEHAFGKDPDLWNSNIKDGKDINLSQIYVTEKKQMQNVLKKMLQSDPKKRPTIKDIMDHEVFQHSRTTLQIGDVHNSAAVRSDATVHVNKKKEMKKTLMLQSDPKKRPTIKDTMDHEVFQHSRTTLQIGDVQNSAGTIAVRSDATVHLTEKKEMKNTLMLQSDLKKRPAIKEVMEHNVFQHSRTDLQIGDVQNSAVVISDATVHVTEEKEMKNSLMLQSDLKKYPAIKEVMEHDVFQQSRTGLQIDDVQNHESLTQTANAIVMFDYYNTKHLQSYKPSTNQWTKMQPPCDNVRNFTPVVLDENMYILRHQEMHRLKYSDPTSKWIELQGTSENHGGEPSAVAMNGSIYVCGGRHSFSRSVEKYDVDLNKWIQMPDMKVARSYPSLVAAQDFIFIIDGHDRSVERFNVEDRSFEEIEQTPRSTIRASSVELEGTLYVADIHGVLSYNIKNKSWKTLELVQWPKIVYNVNIHVVDSELYVVPICRNPRRTEIHKLNHSTECLTLVHETKPLSSVFSKTIALRL